MSSEFFFIDEMIFGVSDERDKIEEKIFFWTMLNFYLKFKLRRLFFWLKLELIYTFPNLMIQIYSNLLC